MSTIKRNIRVTDDKFIADEIKDLEDARLRGREVIPVSGGQRLHFDTGMLLARDQIALKRKPVAVRYGGPPSMAAIGGRSTMVTDSFERSRQ